RVVHQHIESAQIADYLQRQRMDLVFPPDVAGNAMIAGMRAGDRFDPLPGPRHERDARSTPPQFTDQRDTETRSLAGHGGSHAVETSRMSARENGINLTCHESAPARV